MATKSDDQNIPAAAVLWRRAYHAVPPVNFPGTQLSVSFSLVSAVFLTTIRLTMEQVLPAAFGWPAPGEMPTMEAAANCTSVCHSTLLCFGLWAALTTQPYCPNEKLEKAPQWWRELTDALLQFCTGYMIYDGVVNILYLRWNAGAWYPILGDDDILFLVHHMITSTYMTSTRVIQAGHMSAMMCMLLGEITNPLHNAYMMADVAMKVFVEEGDAATAPLTIFLNKWITVSFAAAYLFARVLLFPAFGVHMSYNLIGTKKGRSNIPLGLNIMWNAMIWIVSFGSMSWIEKCYYILVDFASGGVAASGGQEL